MSQLNNNNHWAKHWRRAIEKGCSVDQGEREREREKHKKEKEINAIMCLLSCFVDLVVDVFCRLSEIMMAIKKQHNIYLFVPVIVIWWLPADTKHKLYDDLIFGRSRRNHSAFFAIVSCYFVLSSTEHSGTNKAKPNREREIKSINSLHVYLIFKW